MREELGAKNNTRHFRHFSWLSGLGDWEMFIFSNFASNPFAAFGCYSIHLPNSLSAAWAVLLRKVISCSATNLRADRRLHREVARRIRFQPEPLLDRRGPRQEVGAQLHIKRKVPERNRGRRQTRQDAEPGAEFHL